MGFAGIPIGLALTLVHLIIIPVTNTSINPARSTGVARLSRHWAVFGQLWLFWLAPIVGALSGTGLSRAALPKLKSKNNRRSEPRLL